jgi:hypothetical protein
MSEVVLIDADTIALERDGEDSTSTHLAERLINLLETEPYTYRDVAGTWVEEFPGYLLLLKKRCLNLDIDKQHREDFFRYAKALSTLRNEIRSVRVPMEQDKFEAVGPYPALEQQTETYRQFIRREDDSASVAHGEVVERQLGLDQLQVPYNINRQVSALLDRPTLEAANIVTAVLSDRIAKGLPVEHVDVKPLTDYDAGQWQELVFTIYVDLNSQDANKEWDNMLDEIGAKAHRQGDEIVIDSLSERIGVHFRWKVSNHV